MLSGEKILEGATEQRVKPEVNQKEADEADEYSIARIEFFPGEMTKIVSSELPIEEELTLTPNIQDPDTTEGYSEEWRIACSSLYSCALRGLTPTVNIIGGMQEFQFFPRKQNTIEIV
jgi:hypothetical protein